MQRVDMHHSHAMRWILKACGAIHVLQIDLNHVYLLLDCMWSRDTHEDGWLCQQWQGWSGEWWAVDRKHRRMYDGYAYAYANYTEYINPFNHSDRIGFFYGFGWVRGELCPLHTTTAGVMRTHRHRKWRTESRHEHAPSMSEGRRHSRYVRQWQADKVSAAGQRSEHRPEK